jgi:tRNA1Val (adenine37-N6)-methyltransferase
MASDRFRFKQFTIYHDRCAMKVGTDGVLLGAWCNVDGAQTVLDVGTGSGLIAIMIAQRNHNCVVDAVEIDRPSFLQASENAAFCRWSKRINMHHMSFNDFHKNHSKGYDLIVSNPPWFLNSLTNPDPVRSRARHSHSLSMEDLISGVKKLLTPRGRYCMIMPVTEAETFIEKATAVRLYCREITSVHPNPGKPAKRYLLEFIRDPGEIKRASLILELEKRHEYSDQFKNLTGDFYLSFRY